jgi:hypothetical protein
MLKVKLRFIFVVYIFIFIFLLLLHLKVYIVLYHLKNLDDVVIFLLCGNIYMIIFLNFNLDHQLKYNTKHEIDFVCLQSR